MLRLPSRWKIVFGISLFFNLLTLVAMTGSGWAAIAAIPQNVVTALTGLAGLGMIAWQTNCGFKNLIRSQAHRAKIERAARLHSDELSRDFEEAKRERERRELAAIIRAELTILRDQVQISIGIEYSSIETWKNMKSSNPMSEVNLAAFSAPVFGSSVDKLGILGSTTAEAVIRAYEILGVNQHKALIHTFETVANTRRTMSHVHKARAGYALDCLLAVEQGKPLPGPFSNSSHAEDLRNTK